MPQSGPKASAFESEIRRFEAMADEWWDDQGAFSALHRLNPRRLSFLGREMGKSFPEQAAGGTLFHGKTALDVGCGGGLFSESLARMGFAVTAIDAGERNIAIAKSHAEKSGLTIDYKNILIDQVNSQFDLVAVMEVVEHVPSPQKLIADALARLKPGGCFIGSTLNRTLKSHLLAVIAAEHILRWAPKGVHDWSRFVKPSEFAAWLRKGGVASPVFRGVHYDLAAAAWEETPDLDVNYMAFGVKGRG